MSEELERVLVQVGIAMLVGIAFWVFVVPSLFSIVFLPGFPPVFELVLDGAFFGLLFWLSVSLVFGLLRGE